MTPALDDDKRAAFEAKVVKLARRFDLKPLIELLLRYGYAREDILFESTHEGSSTALVESIRFFPRDAGRGVLITMNLGLLGDNSLLPSYFFHVVEGSRDPDRFYDFIRFFDHRLLENMRRSLQPDEDGSIYRDWNEVLKSFFRMLGPGSVGTMHWLAQHFFPELGVRVTRWAFSDSSDVHAFVTGESKLDGTGILGRLYQSDTIGLGVDLFAEEETNERAVVWPQIVRLRLNEMMLPLLAPFRIPLRVRLKIAIHASWARVDVPFANRHGYLGYERIRGDAESGHTTVIYRGVTGQRKRA